MKIRFETREQLLFFILLFLGLLIFCRLFYLQILKHEFYTDKSLNQLKRIIRLYPHRGHIYDRNKEPFALTQLVFSTYAIPEEIKNKWVFSKLSAPYLHVKRKVLSDKLYQSKSPFIWLNRQSSNADKISL